MDETFWNVLSKLVNMSAFNIDDEEVKSLSCKICKRIMVDASQITCGCQFCRLCIERYLGNGGKFCPVKVSDDCLSILLRDITDYHRERDSNKKILSLMVKCPGNDCDIELELEKLVRHWIQCHKENVDVSPVTCSEELEACEQVCETNKKVTIKDLRNTIDVLKRQKKKLEKTVEEMNDRISSLEREKWNDAQNVDRLLLTVDRMEEKLYDDKYEPFVWIIDNFSQHKAENDLLYSEPFFVFRNGYKMRMLMYPNGAYGDEFVSLYFEIVRGEYDLLLKWPFCCNVTMTVLADDGGEGHSHTVYYLHHRNRSYVYQKPVGHKNVSLGASQFIEYAVLTEPSRLLLCNDRLFLSCLVTDAPSRMAYIDRDWCS